MIITLKFIPFFSINVRCEETLSLSLPSSLINILRAQLSLFYELLAWLDLGQHDEQFKP